jgi:hypothetical protein
MHLDSCDHAGRKVSTGVRAYGVRCRALPSRLALLLAVRSARRARRPARHGCGPRRLRQLRREHASISGIAEPLVTTWNLRNAELDCPCIVHSGWSVGRHRHGQTTSSRHDRALVDHSPPSGIRPVDVKEEAMRNGAMKQLDVLVGSWQTTMRNAWFLEPADQGCQARRRSRGSATRLWSSAGRWKATSERPRVLQ